VALGRDSSRAGGGIEGFGHDSSRAGGGIEGFGRVGAFVDPVYTTASASRPPWSILTNLGKNLLGASAAIPT
jgi:hypothetical protein